MNEQESNVDSVAVALLHRADRHELETFILEHVSVDVILDTFGSAKALDENGKIHMDDIADVDDMTMSHSSSPQLHIDTNNDGINESSSKTHSTVISRNSSNNNVNAVPSPKVLETPTAVDALSLPEAPPSPPQPKLSAAGNKPFKRRTPCICGDPVERWKNDAVRLRCKCLIHAQCLADHLQSALASAYSTVSSNGVRCPYFNIWWVVVQWDPNLT